MIKTLINTFCPTMFVLVICAPFSFFRGSYFSLFLDNDCQANRTAIKYKLLQLAIEGYSWLSEGWWCGGVVLGGLTSYCQAQFQSIQVQSNLNWDLHYNHCKATHPIPNPPHPGQVYLSHLGSWNLACKLNLQ